MTSRIFWWRLNAASAHVFPFCDLTVMTISFFFTRRPFYNPTRHVGLQLAL
jgi:hypothetical protein